MNNEQAIGYSLDDWMVVVEQQQTQPKQIDDWPEQDHGKVVVVVDDDDDEPKMVGNDIRRCARPRVHPHSIPKTDDHDELSEYRF